MARALRYFAASLLLGLIAVWGSENFFWSAPQASLSAPELAMTWIAYSIACGIVVSAVFATGIGGWRAAFLGGALMGWLVEGIVEGTIYQAFPFQLVWTPLAWHALVTGLAVFGLGRASVRWPLWRQAAAWIAVGLFGALFAQFWPMERGAMPGAPETGLYIAGLGLAVPLANVALDRLSPLRKPSRWVLALLPAFGLAIWLLNLAGSMSPLMLVLPLLLGLTWWIMRRLGTPGDTLDFGARAPAWRHCVFLLAPLTMSALAPAGWAALPGGVETNVLVALTTAPAGLALWLWLLWKAARRRA